MENENLKKIFKFITKSQLLTKAELSDFITTIKPSIEKNELNCILNCAKDEIDYEEFVITYQKIVEMNNDIKDVFAILDRNKDGFIDRHDCKALMVETGFDFDIKLHERYSLQEFEEHVTNELKISNNK